MQETYKEAYCQACKITESNSVNGQTYSPDSTVRCCWNRQHNPRLIFIPNNWKKALDNCLAFLARTHIVPGKVFVIHMAPPLSI